MALRNEEMIALRETRGGDMRILPVVAVRNAFIRDSLVSS